MTLTPGAATLAELEAIWRGGRRARSTRRRAPAIEAAAARVAAAAAGDGAGLRRQHRLRQARQRQDRRPATPRALQRNLILSHCSGVGDADARARSSRLMMALKLLSLGRGASGVRWELVALLEGDAGARA